MNRIGRYEWKAHKTAKAIVTKTGFDAYTDQTPLYVKAYKHLGGEKQEKAALIDSMAKVLEPIYNKKETDSTSDAILYYSPQAQAQLHKKYPQKYRENPSWVKSPAIEEVQPEGLLPTDDFKFYKYKHKG